MANLFKVPELLDAIFHYCNREDLVRWVSISHYVFDTVVPYIWQDVTCSTLQLLGLVSRTTVHQGYPNRIVRVEFSYQHYRLLTQLIDTP